MAPISARFGRAEQDAQWLPQVSQYLGRNPVASCLSSKCSKISKWVSFTYSLYTFDLVFFAWFCGPFSLHMTFFIAGFPFPTVL